MRQEPLDECANYVSGAPEFDLTSPLARISTGEHQVTVSHGLVRSYVRKLPTSLTSEKIDIPSVCSTKTKMKDQRQRMFKRLEREILAWIHIYNFPVPPAMDSFRPLEKES
jgi:hypothetical protein